MKDPFVSIPNFRRVNDALYRGGQPTDQGFAQLEALRIKTIVSLRSEGMDDTHEREMAERSGMRWIRIPLNRDTQPTERQALAFLDAVLNEDNHPVFVHCKSGRDRTGAMIAFYRVVVEGWTIHQAYHEALALGMWPYTRTAALMDFIHQLKDHPVYWERAGTTPP